MDKHSERAAFETFAREACGMPETAGVNWNAVWTKAAWEGWQARASQAPAPSTLGQQVAKAQAVMATWTDAERNSVRLEGGDHAAPSPAASIDGPEFVRVLQDYATAYLSRCAPADERNSLVAHIDAHCARLASQSASAKDAARWQYVEDHASACGGGNGFTISCFIPFDIEDMGCGVDAAIEAERAARAAMTRAEQ